MAGTDGGHTLRKTVVVSCPGKVLLAGGYLVLDRHYSGTVIGTRSRFYSVLSSSDYHHHHHHHRFDLKWHPSELIFNVRSPQFLEAHWNYQTRWDSSTQQLSIIQCSHSHTNIEPNKFVELAIRESLRLAIALNQNRTTRVEDHQSIDQPATIDIHICGDNDFYSQPRDSNVELPPFNKLQTSLANVHKTGLGSSAAMVTSLCSAILIFFVPSYDPNSSHTRSILHNLSQFVHSLAQGKVGSGFDVSSAVWGTHVYRRFSESCLEDLLSLDQTKMTPQIIQKCLDPTLNSKWIDPSTSAQVERFKLPKYTTLILADVDAGSHTPSMVGKVLKWKTENPKIASEIWNEIYKLNNRLKSIFEKLNQIYLKEPDRYEFQIQKLLKCSFGNSLKSESLDVIQELFGEVSDSLKKTRRLMKEMGNRSGVPIEPDSQTKLLDECEKIDGVIGTGVPGAGGYDAIWILVVSQEENDEESNKVFKEINKIWKDWKEVSVLSLSIKSWVIGGDRIKAKEGEEDGEEEDGLRVLKSIDDIEGLSKIILN